METDHILTQLEIGEPRLSVLQGIVEQCSGEIQFTNEAEQGTRAVM